MCGESATTSSPGDEHRHERLAAHRLDRGAVERVDVDPVDRDALVPCDERHALDVRRERDPVDADQIQFRRLNHASCSIVVTMIRPQEKA